jgi:diguanylate cyclase (GGDEF)-like protein
VGQSLAGRSAKSGRMTFEDPEGHVGFSNSAKGPMRAIGMPLIVGARVVGVLEARYGEPQRATADAIEFLEMLATHAATAVEAARLYELSEVRSQIDSLTGLFNRRRLDEDLDAECRRCVRYARPLTFVMLDIDYFKAYNDSHGHPQADEALQQVANVMTRAVRATDTAYRYGGEEFCILLRETSGADGMIFAERLRERIEQRFAGGALGGLTASFGVAEFSPDRPTSRALIVAADAAMYESKQRGRNRVMLSTAPPVLDGPTSGES